MTINIRRLIQWKQQGRKIVALTAWDFTIAQLLDAAGIDLVLVGDSMAVVLGYETTLPITLDEIIHHAKAVGRGVKHALIVVDLPFLTYQESSSQAIHSAGRVLKETGAQAVKLEGGYPAMVKTVACLVEAGIPVMGHLGLTPQSIHQLGLAQQGTSLEAGEKILNQAIALQAAGVFAIVLEHIPSLLAGQITQKLDIPTIGIGAGADCDGQVLVTSDILGLSAKQPPFAKVYIDLRESITQAVKNYIAQVQTGEFPG
jgi:3-methyl-2-oxobutanoate hydroxymethyltransferase